MKFYNLKDNYSVCLSKVINEYLSVSLKMASIGSDLTEKIICGSCSAEIVEYEDEGYKGKRGRCPICGVDFPLD